MQYLLLGLWAGRLPCLLLALDASSAPDSGHSPVAEQVAAPPDAGVPVTYMSNEAALALPDAAALDTHGSPTKAEAGPSRAAVADRRPLIFAETATYRVSYGLLGEVARGTVRLTPESGPVAASADPARSMVRAVGSGKGAVLGFAETEKRIESEFNAHTLHSTRWTITRTSDEGTVIDIAEQQQPGTVSLVRKRAGQPDQSASITRASPILDPLGFLLRLRFGQLQAPASFELLDGRALWIMSISKARPTDGSEAMLRLDGQAEPIGWDGTPDNHRTGRSFTIFLSNDDHRTPLRLIVPFGLGEARAELVQISRPATDRPAWHHIVPPPWRYLPAKKDL